MSVASILLWDPTMLRSRPARFTSRGGRTMHDCSAGLGPMARRERRGWRRGCSAAAALAGLQRATPARGSGSASSTRWCSPAPSCRPCRDAAPGASWPSGGHRSRRLGAGARAGRPAPRRVPHQAAQRHRHDRADDPRLLGPGRQRRAPTPSPPSTPTTRWPSWPTTPGARHRAAPGTRPASSPGRGCGSPSPTRWPPRTANRGSGRRATSTSSTLRTALAPGAGVDYVDYHFDPADPIGHAEDSTVATDAYATHFSARWTRDGLTSGGGPDILDRHRNLFARRRVRPQRGHLLRRRRRLRHQHRRPRAGDPLLPRRQQRHLHPARAPLLPEHRAGADVPPGARHPRDHGLLRLQRRPPSA